MAVGKLLVGFLQTFAQCEGRRIDIPGDAVESVAAAAKAEVDFFPEHEFRVRVARFLCGHRLWRRRPLGEFFAYVSDNPPRLPEDAARYELQEGDDIIVESRVGTWPGKVLVDENVLPGTLFGTLAAFRFTDQRAAHVIPVQLKRGS